MLAAEGLGHSLVRRWGEAVRFDYVLYSACVYEDETYLQCEVGLCSVVKL